MSVFLEVENFGRGLVKLVEDIRDIVRSGSQSVLERDAEERAMSWGKQLPEYLEIGDKIYHFGDKEMMIIKEGQVAIIPKDPDKEVQIYPPIL